MKSKFLLMVLVGLIVYSAGIAQTPFGAGNLVVLRVGAGSGGTYGSTTYLDEYTPAGAFVRTLQLPGNNGLSLSQIYLGTGSSAGTSSNSNILIAGNSNEGRMCLSTNGQYLTFPGYVTSCGGLSGSSAIGIPRSIASVSFGGAYSTYTPPVIAPSATASVNSFTSLATLGYTASTGTISAGQYVFGNGIALGTTVASTVTAVPASLGVTTSWTAGTSTATVTLPSGTNTSNGIVTGLAVSGLSGGVTNAYVSTATGSASTFIVTFTGTTTATSGALSFLPSFTLSAASTFGNGTTLTFVNPSVFSAVVIGTTTSSSTSVTGAALASGSNTPLAGTTYSVFGTNITPGTTVTGYGGGASLTLSNSATGGGSTVMFFSTYPFFANAVSPRIAFSTDGTSNFLLSANDNTTQYYNAAGTSPSGVITGSAGSMTGASVVGLAAGGSTSPTTAQYYFPYNNSIYMSSSGTSLTNRLSTISSSNSIPTTAGGTTISGLTYGTNSFTPYNPSAFYILKQNGNDVMYVCESGGATVVTNTSTTTSAAALTNASTISTAATAVVGQYVSCIGVPSGTTVSGVSGTGPYTITLSKNTNAAIVSGATVIFSGQQTTTSAASSTSTITVVSKTNLAVGQVVSGTGVPANTWITSITGASTPFTITLSNTVSVSSGATLTFAYYGLLKYYNNAGAWTSLGGVGCSSDAYQGIVASASSNMANLYALRNVTAFTNKIGQLVSFIDNGGATAGFSLSGNEGVIVIAANNTNSTGGTFRSLCFAPQAPQATNYYYKGTGALNNITSWGTNADGTGNYPVNFTTDAQTFIIGGTVSVVSSSNLTGNWTVSGTGSLIQVGDGTNAASLTISSTGNSITGSFNVTNNGNLINQSSTTPTLGTLSAGSKVTFDGSGVQTIPAKTYDNLTITNTSATVSAAGSFTINNVLTIADGANLNMVTSSLTCGTSFSTSNNSGSGTGILQTQALGGSGAINTSNVGVARTFNFTVKYNGASAQTLPQKGNTFLNLTIANLSGVGMYTSYTINGILSILDGCTLNTGTNSSTISGTFTTSNGGGTGTGKLNLQYSSTTPVPAGITYNFEVDYSSTSSQTIIGGNYTILDASNTGTAARTLASGIVAVSSSFIPGSTGTYTVTSGNTLSLGYTTSLPTLGTNNPNLFNLAVTGGTVTAPSTLTIGGSFSISGGKFIAPSGNFNVAGNWSNTGGTYTHNSGTVVLNGTSQVLIGSTTFNNFTKSVVTAATLTLPAGQTQTFAGTLSLNGATGQLLTIASSTGNTVASINPTATNIYNVAVSYNTNTSGTTISATNSTDNGNNTGWAFVAASTWTGANSTNWNDANNWTPTGVPASGAVVTITTGGSNNLVIEVSPTVASLSISSGNAVTLNTGKTLSISGAVSNAGTFSAASGSTVVVSGAAGISGVGTTAFNNLTINSGASLIGGIFSISGTFTNSGTYTASGGTVTFNGSAAQTVPAGTYFNLSIFNTGATVSAGGNIIVSNGLNIANGATFDMTTYQLTNNGTANYVSYTSGGGLQNTNSVNLATVNANIALGQSVSNQFIPEGTIVSSVTTPAAASSSTSSTGTANPIVATSINGTIVVGQPVSGTNIPPNTFVKNVSGTSITLSKAPTGTITGTITFSSFTQVTLSANAIATIGNTNTYFIVFGAATSGNGTLNTQNVSSTPINANKIWAFTVNYNGSASQSIPTGSTFSSLTNSNTSGTVSSASITVNNILTLLDGSTMDMGTGIFSCGGTTDYTNFSTSNGGGSGTGKLSTKNTTGSGAIKSNYNSYTWNFTVEYAASSSQTTSQGAQTYKNFISANTTNLNLYTSANVTGTLTINSGCKLSVGSTQSLNGDFTPSGTGILSLASSTTLQTSSSKIFTFEVDYNGISNQTIVAGNYTNLDASQNTTTSSTGSTNPIVVASATGIAVGQSIVGTNIPANTTVTAVSGTSITLSNAPTATITGSIFFGSISTNTKTTSSTGTTNPIVVNSAIGIAVGQTVTGANIPSSTTVSAVSGTSITLSNAPTATITGNITFAGTGARTFGAGTVAVSASFIPGVTSSFTNGGTINFNGTGAQTIPAFNYNNLTISGTRTINTNVTFASGTIGIAGVFTPSATFSGTGKFDAGSSTVSFNSTTIAQSIPAFNFNNLTINNTFGTTTLAGAVTANGLTLTSGVLALSTNNLTLASGASVSVTSGSYINATGTGVLIRNSVGNVATLFPIGTSTTYTPITITNTTGTSDLSVNLQTTLANAPGDPTQVANLQWNVLGSAATTATVQFQFNGANLPVGFLTNSTCEIGTYKTSYVATACSNSGSNGTGTPSGTNPYTVSAAGFIIPNSDTNYYVVGNSGNVVVLATTWVGSAIPADNSWTNAANWSNGVPTSNVDVVIPAVGSGRYPVLSSSQSVKNLTIGSNASLTLNAANLTPTLSFTNNGTVNGSGTLITGGTVSTIAGNGTVGNVTIKNNVSVTGTMGITGVLTLQSGTFTTNGNVTLKSTSLTNSGVLDKVGVSPNTGTIIGNVTVERFIPAGYRAYRDLSSGVFNNSNTLYNTWQESGAYTSGYGMFITGNTTNINTTVDGSNNLINAVDKIGTTPTYLDFSKNKVVSAYLFNNGYNTTSPFIGIANTGSTILNPFQTYRVLVRGDRSFDLYNTPVQTYGYVLGLRMQNATTLRATGQLITGDVTYNTSGVTSTQTGTLTTANSASLGLNSQIPTAASDGKGWSMIANPYACPVQWSTANGITGVFNNAGTINIESSYFYLDPTSGATGKYISCPASACSNGSVSGAPIQANQSIFVHTITNAAGNPVVVFKEANKVTASSSRTGVFGTTALNNLLISLHRKIDNSLGYQKMDCANLLFNESYSNGLGNEDGSKLAGATDNLAIKEGTTVLAVDGRKMPTTADMVGIDLSKLATADYQLQIDGSSYQGNGLTPYLIDIYKRTSTVLKTGINTVSFTVDTAVRATYQNRFSIAFKSTTLPISSITATATQANGIVKVNWTVIGATATTNYTIEKSTDGTVFTAISKTQATDYTDNSATEGTVYYRIKATEVDGSSVYSNTAKLTTNNSQLTTVYPNPMTGKIINVQLANTAKGKYTVTLTNILGQQVHQQTFKHNGGSATHSITTGQLAKGTYQLTITGVESKQQIHIASIEVQ